MLKDGDIFGDGVNNALHVWKGWRTPAVFVSRAVFTITS